MLDFAARPGGSSGGRRDDTVPNSLGNLFAEIAGQKRKTGVLAPKRFIQKIKHDWEQYRSYDEHQVRPQLLGARECPRPIDALSPRLPELSPACRSLAQCLLQIAGNFEIWRAVVGVATIRQFVALAVPAFTRVLVLSSVRRLRSHR